MALTPLPFDPLLERLRQATHGLYEIRDELGRGGMAVVYMAKDLRLGRPVAIKVMQPALLHAEGMTDRFLQEARGARAGDGAAEAYAAAIARFDSALEVFDVEHFELERVVCLEARARVAAKLAALT